MNLIKHTHNELIFKTAPVVIQKINRLGIIVWCLCLIYFPFLLYNGEVKKLKCERVNFAQINCHLAEKKLLGLVTIQDINIENIKEIKVINNRVFINNIYWSKYKIDELTINRMLSNFTQNNLVITYDHRVGKFCKFVFLAPLFMVIGFRMKQWSGNYVIFNHRQQKILQSQVNLKGEMIKEIDFCQIRNVEKIEKLNQKQEKFYQINLNLNTVNNLGFSETIWLDNTKNEAKATELVKILQDFIKIEE